MSKVTLKGLVETINEAPTGGFIGISGYQSKKGDVSSVVGQLGCSYGKARQLSIQALQEAVANGDFEPITVTGQCYKKDGVWNSRARSNPIEDYEITYSKKEVQAFAEEILEGWENPKDRNSNKVQLTDKEDGLSINTETKSINMTLLIHSEDYDVEASKLLKEGMEHKVTAQMPEANVKAQIRERFERKMKAYTIEEGKFTTLSINGKKFQSEHITF